MIKHFLRFDTSGHGLKEIDEPVKFDGVEFGIEKEDDRNAIDSSFVGENIDLELYSDANHQFDKIIYNDDKFGGEAIVKQIVKLDDDEQILGEIDFEGAETDLVNSFKYKLTEESERMLLKKRQELKVNLFSDKDLDGNDIAPVQTHKMLLKAKPITQTSLWENNNINKEYATDSLDGDYIMPLLNQMEYDVKNSLSWIDDFDEDTGDNFRFIDAKSNLRQVGIKIKLNGEYKYRPEEANTEDLDKLGVLRLEIRYGQTYDSATLLQDEWFHAFYGDQDQSIPLPSEINVAIPSINNTDKIWIYFRSSTKNAAVNRINIQSTSVEITATSIAYNTIVRAVRLIDAIKYVVKSTCGLSVIAPRWEFGGEFYDQYITTTALMRGLIDKPFNLSFKDIRDDYFPEVFADYQIRKDNTVFVGIYEDFYRNYEIGNYQQSMFDSSGNFTGQIQGYGRIKNPKYMINDFRYSYKNYVTQKENEEANTYDIVHGSSQWMLSHKKASNKKEIEVGVIRDSFYIELNRRKAYDLTETAATQDDDKIYIIDVVPYVREGNWSFVETSTLQHSAPSTGVVVLTNDQSFSWLQLGIVPGSQFFIAFPSDNAGIFTVTSVTDTQITLYWAGYNSEDIAEENTTYAYQVSPDVLLTNRTNEGFTQISNIADGNNYSNLPFTVKRNVLNYYGQYLATCNIWADEQIKNTLYDYNSNAITRFGSETSSITEGASFIPVNPILDKWVHKAKLVMTLQDFINLDTAARLHNGFIRFFDAAGLPIKGYIRKAAWKFLSNGMGTPEDFLGEATVEVEQRYVPFYMEIISDGNGLITINGEVTPNTFTFSIDELGKLSIFDETGKLLHIPVYYDRVKVNNSGAAPTAQQLMIWLQALKNEN